MIIKNLTLAVLAFSYTNLWAANHMVFMGGGGEPQGSSTIFDGTVESLGKNFQNSNWQYQVSFNGGHSQTESLISANFTKPVKPVTPFSGDNYKKLIQDYITKINSGEIKSGDQMMVIINSHGAEKTDGKETTHKIALGNEKPSQAKQGISNYDSLSGSDVVSLDSLQELVKLTNQKGIKLGIVDMSCHSGNTQALKKDAPNTCIITSTGPVHYGFSGATTFNGKLAEKLKPGVNLEDAFLSARAEALDYGYPMISTPEGQEVSAEIYDSITPYLYYKNGNTDKLTKYIDKNSKDQIICQRDYQFKDLIEKIDRLQAAAAGKPGGYNGQELKKLLQAYKTQQDAMMSTLAQMGSSEAANIETFSSPLGKSGKNHDLQMSWRNIVTANPDDTISYFQKQLASTKSLADKVEYQAVISNWTQLKNKRNEILAKYPQMANLEKKSKELTDQLGNNYTTVHYIAFEEKKFYNELYKKKQTENKSDPCRSIVL